MAEKTFNEYGKTQAIDLLFEGSGFSRQGKIGFEPAAGSFYLPPQGFLWKGWIST